MSVPALEPWPGRVALALVALAALAAAPIHFRVRASYRAPGRGARGTFELSLLGGLAVWRIRVPLLRLERSGEAPAVAAFVGRAIADRYGAARREAAEQEEKKILTLSEARRAGRSVLVAAGALRHPALALLKRVSWSHLSWRTTLSLPDAAFTGLAAGGVWAVKGILAASLRGTLRLAGGQPEFEVTPEFEGRGTVSRFEGIGVLRVGHIILALPGLVRGLWRMRTFRAANGRRLSGRRSAWRSTPFRVS